MGRRRLDRDIYFHFRLKENREPKSEKDTLLAPRGGVTVLCKEQEMSDKTKLYSFTHAICSVSENYSRKKGVKVCRSMANQNYRTEIIAEERTWEEVLAKAEEIAKAAYTQQTGAWMNLIGKGKLKLPFNLRGCELVLKQRSKKKEAATV